MKAAALFGMVLAVARTAYVQSAAPSCIVWKAASEGTHSPPGTFFAGLTQGRDESGFCRLRVQNSSSSAVLVGRYSEGGPCFYTSLVKYGNKRNGTASTGFEASADCGLEWADRQSMTGSFPDSVVKAGSEPTAGATIGMCLARGRAHKTLIPGQLYLDGARVGQCCWSAGNKESC
eukprot:gene23818-27042_t